MNTETTTATEPLASDAATVLPLKFQVGKTPDRTWASAMNYSFIVEQRNGEWFWSAWDRSLTSCTLNPCETQQDGIAKCNAMWTGIISKYLASR